MDPLLNANIEQGLQRLFDHASTFNTSIDLVQKLALHFKLDTFIDKDAHTHVTTTKSDANFKRLSIAGSLILIDIDFVDDGNVINVALSLANHAEDSGPTAAARSPITGRRQQPDTTCEVITVNPVAAHLSSMNHSAETILLANLTAESKKLGPFPVNLKYMASLDGMSQPNIDLFVLLDQVGVLLHAVNEVEPTSVDDWQFPYISSVGQAQTNDSINGKLGVFLNFWQDYRFINHETGAIISGNDYHLSANVERLDSLLVYKYWNGDVWTLDGAKFEFEFVVPDGVSSASQIPAEIPFMLSFKLNHAVMVPIAVLQLLDLASYELAQEGPGAIYDALNIHGDVQFQTPNDRQRPRKLLALQISIRQDFPQQFVALRSVSLKHLSQLVAIVPCLRNHIVLLNLLQTTKCPDAKIEAYSFENEAETNTKKNLHESLNLSENVANEELLGLSLGVENPMLSSIKSVKPAEVDIHTFIHQEVAADDKSDGAGSHNFSPNLQLIIEEVDYTSPKFDIMLNVNGVIGGENGDAVSVDVGFRITNGQIKPRNDDHDMGATNEKSDIFVRVLNLTEDLLRAIEIAYMA